MNLLENEAKLEFFKYGIPIPKGKVITEVEQTPEAVSKLKPPYIVKAQIPVGGRGKAGGILPATSALEAKEAVAKLVGASIKGLMIRRVLIEEKLQIRKELYLGITVDRFSRCYVALASAMGGMEIEDVAEKTPGAIIRTKIDSQLGMRSFHALALAKKLGYSGSQLVELSNIVQKLYRASIENDAETAEINPLVETENGNFAAADARMVIDDNALFRHFEYQSREAQSLSTAEALALKNNLAYVKLDGDIGIVGNGAGLVMATIDLLNLFGGKPANFLDLGGGATAEAIRIALGIVLGDADTRAILVNVLGGITHCDEVAKGIVEASKHSETKKPLIVRLVGTNQEQGQKILLDAGFKALENMEEAAKRAVESAAGEKR